MSEQEPLLADRVVRAADGTIALRLLAREREILRALLADLETVVAAPPLPEDDAPLEDADAEEAPDDGDPEAGIRARLYPTAAPEDARADASYRRLVHEDLEAGRRERIAVVEATLDARSIDDEQASAWLLTLNDLRLVLGTRLDVSEESETRELDPEDPQAAARVVYAYTGWLEGQFVDVLADALPDVAERGAAEDPPDPDDDAIAADDS